MNQSPLLSIIVPVYNVEPHLEKCLSSIQKQTFRNLEILAVDDGSSDGCAKILQSYAAKDSRIRVLRHEKNRGLFQARLTGVAAAQGEYIAFVDGDDAVTLDYYRPLIQRAEEENADMVMGNTIMEDENHWRFRYNSNFGLTAERTLCGKEIFRRFFENEGACFSWHTVYNKIYRRSLWKQALPDYAPIQERLIMTEDIAFSVVLYYYAQKMCFLPIDGYIYYRHSAASTGVSASVEAVRSKFRDVRRVFEFVKAFLESHELLPEFGGQYREWKERYFRWHSWNVQEALNRFQLSAGEAKQLKREFLEFYGKDDFEFARREDSFFTELKSSWNKQTEDLIGLICSPEVKAVSFDMFDTLVMRPFWNPDDLFRLVQIRMEKRFPQYRALSFYDMRIEAENSARKRLSVSSASFEDVTLEEIYREMSRLYLLPEEDCRELMQEEERLEIQFCSPRKSMKRLYELSLYIGKKVIITSDMYLPESVITRILENCGYRGHAHLYLSSSCRRLKATGNLYRMILSKEGLLPSELLHIGDSWHSDIQAGQAAGLRTFFVPKASDVFANWVSELKTNRCMKVLKEPSGEMIRYEYAAKQLPIRCMMALIANRYFDNPFYHCFYEGSDYNADPYLIGLYPVGMMVFGFVRELIDDAKKQGYDTLHFLARDGYLLQKVYDLLRPADAPPSHYFYTSRKALLSYAIHQPRDLFSIAQSIQITSHTPAELLSLYAPLLRPLTEEDRKRYYEAGVLLDVPFRDMSSFVSFVRAVIEISYDEKKAAASHSEMERYIRSIFQPHDAAIDLGYSGTLQGILCSLAGYPIDVYFLYSNGSTSAHTADRYGFRMKCYYDYTPAGSVSVRESLLMENGPSCIGYRKNGGTLSPVFEKNPLCYAEKYVYEEVHRGAYEFAQELLHHFADWQELFQLRAAEVSAPFEYFLCHAPAFDRALFSCCSMEDEVYAGISGYSLETIWGEDMAERGLLGTQPPSASSAAFASHSLPKGMEDLYTDGLFVRAYQWANRKFPKGSKSRENVKKIAARFFKEEPKQ